MDYYTKYIKYKLKYNMMKNEVTQYQQPPSQDLHAKKRASERFVHLKNLLPDNVKINSMIDIGAGNAQITSYIAQQLNAKTIYAVDVYPEEKFVQPSETMTIIYKQDKDCILPFSDSSIDLVTAFMSLHHIKNLEKLINEIHRVLSPSGLFFYREHDVTSQKMKIFLDNVHLKFEKDPQKHSIDDTYYWTKSDLEAFTIAHGFKKIGDSLYKSNNVQGIYHTMYTKNDI